MIGGDSKEEIFSFHLRGGFMARQDVNDDGFGAEWRF
jgi:hypothetical protein